MWLSRFIKKIPIILLGLLLVIAACWLLLTDRPSISRIKLDIDNVAYDATIKLISFKNKKVTTPIVAVDIDEKSIQQIGRWPWPRQTVAELVKKVRSSGAVIIGFDITFSQPEENIVNTILQAVDKTKPENKVVIDYLKTVEPQFDYDKILEESLTGGDTVLGYVFHNDVSLEDLGVLPKPSIVMDNSEMENLSVYNMLRYRASIAMFQTAAKFGGFLTVFPDEDGLLRRIPLILRYKSGIYPSLALEIVRQYLLIDSIKIKTTQIGDQLAIDSILLGNVRIPTDAYGQVFIPYNLHHSDTTVISAQNILSDKFDKKKFENAIVIIGSSAFSLKDLHATPIDPVFPGLLIHTIIIHHLLGGKLPFRPSWAIGMELTITIIIGVICALFFPFVGALIIIASTLIIISATIFGNVYLLQEENLVISMMVPMTLTLVISIANLVYGFFFEVLNRAKLKNMFGQYVPPELVDVMNENPKLYGFEGETKTLTVLFSDIRGFTTISEGLSATQLKQFLNQFFTPITEIVFKNHGTIDKYVGDMIVAFWGAPVADLDHAKNAVNCALEMIKKTKELSDQFKASGLPEIKIGIGLNTGEMNVGDMGSSFRRAYTVLGNAVNVGSRLEGLTKYYGVDIIVGEDTRENQQDFVFLQVDKVRVKGKQAAVNIFAVLCRVNEASQELLQKKNRFDAAFAAYIAQNFALAKKLIAELLADYPDSVLYKLYKERIDTFMQSPPPKEWDGVYEWHTK